MFSIARMAETYDVALAPHCPLGPIALASCLQVDACSVNFVFQETSVGIHYNSEDGQSVDPTSYVTNPIFTVDEEGFMALPSLPGLGIEVDEERVRANAIKGHDWKDRAWQLEDGTPTTW